ncbi:MAG: EF-P beta-lysylation protein EpmB [Planctomycetia bacterium]
MPRPVNVRHGTPMPVTIAPPDTAPPAASWQRELAAAIRTPEALCRALDLDPAGADAARCGAVGFPMLVPRGYVARMRRGDPNDPLLLQVLPRQAELHDAPGFTGDPLGEGAALVAPGLVQKYAGRALLLVTGGCAINCRYCFRREFPYSESGAHAAGVDEALTAVAADGAIHEVILSGGDPLLVDDQRLRSIVNRVGAIPHVRRLRIHSRLPVVLPERVTDELVSLLAETRLACTVVIHANHARELDESVAAGLGALRRSGAILLNQAVLLRGVNDSVAALAELSERLVDLGVVPYYLHLLDRVRGAAHFEVGEDEATRLHEGLRGMLPGYAVPRLAREVPGAPAKTWLG